MQKRLVKIQRAQVVSFKRAPTDMPTYREIAEMIEGMPDARKDDDATVFVSGVGEVYGVSEFGKASDVDQNGDVSGVLDDGHYLMKI